MAQSSITAPPTASRGGPARILLVDDDQTQLEIMAVLLGHLRPEWRLATCTATPSWVAAVAIDPDGVDLPPADLALIDYRSQQCSGSLDGLVPALARRLPVIVISGAPERVPIPVQEVVAGVVAKPYALEDVDDLLQVTTRILDTGASAGDWSRLPTG